jgi:Acyl-CoA reductase (LuxC)
MNDSVFKVGYLPGLAAQDVSWIPLPGPNSHSTIKVEVPQLSAAQMLAIADQVKRSSSLHLKTMTVSEIIRVIDKAVARLLDLNDHHRQKLEALLPSVTGFDSEMIRLGLTNYLLSFRAPQLHRFVTEDFANPKLIDEFQPRAKNGWSKAIGADLGIHIWAGNVPALPLWSMVCALLVKSGFIGKVSSGEPVFASVFAALLVEIEPRWRDCFAVVWWKGGNSELEAATFERAELVLAYGGNAALAQIRSRIPPHTRFLGYGHKISFGIVTASALGTRKGKACSELAALDIARWDQQGCYSPQVFYVQTGGAVTPRIFAEQLFTELASLEHTLHRRALSFEEAASLATYRQAHEFEMLNGSKRVVFGEKHDAWCVVYSDEALPLLPGPLNRCILVVAVDSIDELIALIKPQSRYLQTAGVAASPEELLPLAECLGAVGVTRICALGAMTSPQAGWHHDGRFSLLDLVRMVDVEYSAESLAESFTRYEL